MSIRFACPSCGRDIKVRDEAAGQTGTCNNCGNPVRVPEPNREIIPTPQVQPNVARRAPTELHITPRRPDRTDRRAVPAAAAAPVVNVHVQQTNVNSQTGAGGSTLGIAALILGGLAIPIAWIPFFGLITVPLSVLGLLLGCIGILLAVLRMGRGLGMAIVGSAVSGLALFFAVGSTAGTAAVGAVAVDTANKEMDKDIERAKQEAEKLNQSKPETRPSMTNTANATKPTVAPSIVESSTPTTEAAPKSVSRPSAATTSVPSPPDDPKELAAAAEKKWNSALTRAEAMIGINRPDDARKILEQIVKEGAGTPAAEKAAQWIKKLDGAP